MSDYHYLVGAEQVQNASHTISHAAERMVTAASTMDDTLFRFLRAFEAAVERMESAIEKLEQKP